MEEKRSGVLRSQKHVKNQVQCLPSKQDVHMHMCVGQVVHTLIARRWPIHKTAWKWRMGPSVMGHGFGAASGLGHRCVASTSPRSAPIRVEHREEGQR